MKEEIKREIKKYLETNKNGNTTYQNVCDTAKTVLWRKFTAINAYIEETCKVLFLKSRHENYNIVIEKYIEWG